MSSHETHKAALRMARIESQARAQQQAARRNRLSSLLVVLAFAAAAVAVSVAASSRNGRSSAASGGKLVGASLSRNLFAGIPQRGTCLETRTHRCD